CSQSPFDGTAAVASPLVSPQKRSSPSEVNTIRFSGVPTARIFPPTTSILASLIFTTTPGSMVSTERTVTVDPFITYTYPSSQTVGSVMLPETSIILQNAIGSSGFSMPSSSVEQAANKHAANNRNTNFFILKLFFVI